MIPVSIRSIFLALLCLLLSACGEPVEPQIRIGIHVWPGYDTLIVARDQGYLANSGIQLIETPSATESIRAFQNETVDGAFLTLDEVLRLSERGHDPVVVLITDFSNGADAVLGQPGISSLDELKGKTVGVEPNALGAYMLARALSDANLEPHDVTTVSMPIGETETAFLDKRVDAVVTFEPYLTRIQNVGGSLLFDSTRIPGEITDVLVVRRSIAQNSPKTLQRLIDSYFKALSELTDGSEQALSIVADRENVSIDELQELLGGLTIPSRQDNLAMLSNTDTRLTDTISRLAAVMKEHKMLSPSFTEHEYRDDRFVKGVSE